MDSWDGYSFGRFSNARMNTIAARATHACRRAAVLLFSVPAPASCFAHEGNEGNSAISSLLAGPPTVDTTGRAFPNHWSKFAPIFFSALIRGDRRRPPPSAPARAAVATAPFRR